MAGVIRVSEIKQRSIPHALVLQTDNVCAKIFRAPALKTDGLSQRSDCIPEGARVQLDPALDLSKIAGLSPAERTVARALQVYGGYVIDRGDAPVSVSFERAVDATGSSPGSVYAAAGLTVGLLRPVEGAVEAFARAEDLEWLRRDRSTQPGLRGGLPSRVTGVRMRSGAW